jgi:hypothetical protein
MIVNHTGYRPYIFFAALFYAAMFYASMLFATMFFARTAQGQDGATEAALDVYVEVYRAADLVTTPIDFGTVLINSKSGTVAMDPNGDLIFSGGILKLFDGPSGPAMAGTLTMDANAGATASIALSSSVHLGTGVFFTPELDSHTVVMQGGPVTVKIFGSIHFPANTQTGDRNGVLTVTVSYN